MESSFQHFSVQYVFGLRNEYVLRVRWVFSPKIMTHKLCQKANFENGGTTFQISIEHFVNTFTAKGT